MARLLPVITAVVSAGGVISGNRANAGIRDTMHLAFQGSPGKPARHLARGRKKIEIKG